MAFGNSKIWIISWTALALVAAPIICCCLIPQAEAAQTVPSCHASQADGQETSHSDTGDCDCQDQKILADKGAAAHILTVPSSEDARWNLVWAELFPHGSVIISSEQTAYHPSPPEDISSVPLFIQHSNLRL